MVVQVATAPPPEAGFPFRLPRCATPNPWDEVEAELLAASYSGAAAPTTNHQPSTDSPTVADVLRRYGPKYLADHPDEVEPYQAKVLTELIQCRTAILGGHAWKCKGCGHKHLRFHSCRNRHCPTCGGPARAEWLDRMLDWKLPVGYMHGIFTLPHALLRLVRVNRKALYDLLFHATWIALSEEFGTPLGIQLAAIIVLHTWGQRMNPHTHSHCLVPIGGLSFDGTRWVRPSDPDAFLKADRLATRFRDAFLCGLESLHRNGELNLPGPLARLADKGLFDAYLNRLRRKKWVVHCVGPSEKSEAPDAAIKYLANYVKGTAIRDSRIVADDGRHVWFTAKDYRHDGREMTLRATGEEFVRRFLWHILPPWSARVRYYGFLAHCCRNKNLEACRRLLGVPERSADDPMLFNDWDADDEADDSTPTACPKCGGRDLEWLFDILPMAPWRQRLHLHTLPASALLAIENRLATCRPP